MPRAEALPDAAGADVGSTLAKLVLPADGDGGTRSETLPARDLEAVAARIAECAPARVGLTGARASALARLLALPHRHFEESQAWAAGARAAVAAEAGAEPFLLVSVGTGTSIMRVDPEAVARVGGTALGGGTLLGLGRRLSGARSFEELARLAARGDRGRVDLRIGDVYGDDGGAPLPALATASAFGRLAREAGGDDDARPEDLAAAVVGLVGENAGLLCMAHAGAQGARRIVFGGSALTGNESLAGLLRLVCLAFGTEPHFPEQGPYLGALGARALARAGSARQAVPTR